MTGTLQGPLVVADEVRSAVAEQRPVVALESTIFTHGLPRPRNLEVALESEQLLRDLGVVAATIGVLAGRAIVGLSTEQIAELSGAEQPHKISQRDLAVAAAKQLSGGTTVAATSFLAHRAGIRVFSTGGLGGVHVGASHSFDESADLPVLAHTPILVVAAGVKSILDVRASLERMETLSLAVVGYRTTRYPAFYVADSGLDVDYAIDGPDEAARLIAARDALGIDAAVIVANPVPADEQLAPDEHEAVLAAAWQAAAHTGVTGGDATPFLLDYIQRATDGRSLAANLAVYRNNVRLGGEIAASLRGS